MTVYRFLETRNGVTSFARVGLDAVHSDEWSVSTDAVDPMLARRYGRAIDKGIGLARIEHEAAGGSPQRVTVHALEYSPVDTTDDAVTAATAAALWLELGYPEPSISVVHGDRGWTVQLSPT
jgi:hypothetical protein